MKKSFFKTSGLGSAKNYPGGRREVSGGAFAESRHIANEEQNSGTQPTPSENTQYKELDGVYIDVDG